MSRSHLHELQMIISKMPLQDCCNLVSSEFGLHWNKVSRAVRNARLPMTSTSVASILKKYASKILTAEEITDVVTRLRLKSIAIHPRTWHVIKLMDQIKDEPINSLITLLPSRVTAALNAIVSNNNKKPQVQTITMGDYIFISVQLVSGAKQGSVLYVASPPGQPVAFVSTLHSNTLRACVKGLGYKEFEDACLSGKDIPSLLRIYNNGTNAARVSEFPDFIPAPRIARGGIDFTNSEAIRNHMSQMFGPNPPILDTLKVKAEKPFLYTDLLTKKIKITLNIKSDNALGTLRKWAEMGVLSPESELLRAFHQVRSNQIHMAADD